MREPDSILTYRCADGHGSFEPYDNCPACGAQTTAVEERPLARLLSHTEVHVGPGETPFVLGIAETAGGAKTLCIVESDVNSDGVATVVLRRRRGLYYATPV